jgi:hypothetical protein
MTNKYEKQLKAPFSAESVKWRAGATNKEKTKALALAYIDARDVMDRLDEVFDVQGWQDKYDYLDNGTIVCSIGCLIGDEWIWKSDGAGQTNYEGEKGGMSDAFKRAAVKWGVGRYLYGLPAVWVKCEARGNTVKLLETPNISGGKKKPQKKAEKKADVATNNRPYDPQTLKAKIEERAGIHRNKQTKATQADGGIVASHINDIFDGDKTKRYELCKWLTGKSSTKEMGSEYIHAIKDWMGVDSWDNPPDENAMKEAQTALSEALKASGQKELI